MPTLNLGILAHADTGKASLTGRLLFAAGVIDEIGSVVDGSAQTRLRTDKDAVNRKAYLLLVTAGQVPARTTGSGPCTLITEPPTNRRSTQHSSVA